MPTPYDISTLAPDVQKQITSSTKNAGDQFNIPNGVSIVSNGQGGYSIPDVPQTSKAPTIGDIYGAGSNDANLNNAEAAKTASFNPDVIAQNNAKTRSDVLSNYQSQINALNQEAANARARITTAFAPVAANRVGQTTALEARRGLVGSDFGNAQTDTVNTENTNELNSKIAVSDAEFARQKENLNNIITNAQEKEIALRTDATQKGAQAKIDEINSRGARAQDMAQNAIKALIVSGINDPANPNYKNSINQIASTTGLSTDKVSGMFSDAISSTKTAKLKAEADAATLAKTKAETGAILTPEEVAAKQKADNAYQASQTAKNWQDIAKIRNDMGDNSPVTTVGGQGIIAGHKVDPKIANDVQAVLEGRNTLFNIRQTMGRTNAAAAYMQKMRDSIAGIDPKFDFVASDAGGKFVSSTFYQKAYSAITSVEPNIDKAVQLSNDVGRIGVKGVDALLQKTAMQFGDTKVSNFHEAQKLIADEIGLALGQGTVSDMKLQLGFDVTDPSVSQEVFASNMKLVKEFIDNRKTALNNQRYSSSVVGNQNLPTNNSNQAPTLLKPEDIPLGMYQASDGLLYKK